MLPRFSMALVLLLIPCTDESPPVAEACAAAPGRGTTVDIASESAIIIWDGKTGTQRTQHFIRRASFSTSANGEMKVKDFGFLVPTPSQPKIVAADDRAFDALAAITAPAVETRNRPASSGTGCGCASARREADEAAQAGKVDVLGQGRVGNLDYQIVKSEDAQALTDWLNKNQYEIRPALTRWMEPYLRKNWVITAFKIAKDEKTSSVATQAVRMSFEAKEPFYPYREPDDMSDASGQRLLRVFFVGDGKANALAGAMQWVGRIVWANRPAKEQWSTVVPFLNIPDLQLDGNWLTEFEDPSSSRRGNVDVSFTTKGSDQSTVRRSPKIVYVGSNSSALPTFLVFTAIVLGMCLVRTRRSMGR